MDQQQVDRAAEELARLGARYWAGEAEIVAAFFDQPRSKEEHIRWLRLQVYKEMYGSGLLANPGGIIQGLVQRLQDQFPRSESREGRQTFSRTAMVLQQEFDHFMRFADLLEEISGEEIRFEELKRYQMPEDRGLQEVRSRFRESAGDLAEAAIDFTEGGRSAIFWVGMKQKGDEFLDGVARVCNRVFTDELEHQEHGAGEVAAVAKTEEDWARVGEMVEAICQQRLRMRNEMFGFPVTGERLQEIAQGKIEPLAIG
jgi:hypothetical protein